MARKITDLREHCPGSALRVVLVKVGEEKLAAAGLPALTRQVHGLSTIYK